MRILGLVSAAGVLSVSLAAAQNNQALGTPGGISGIAAYPSSGTIYVPILISVAGWGQCGQVLVSFGDGTSTTLTSVNFPREVQHAYKTAGRYVVSARPGMSCNAPNAITSTVTIEGSTVDLLCALTGCDDARPTCKTAYIKSASYTAPLEPNEEVTLHGCGFGGATTGTRPGVRRVLLKGAFPAAGASVPLTIVNWSETAITARVPALTGVRDQIAQLQVEVEPASSNLVPVGFRATRQLRWTADPGVLRITCSPAAAFEWCRPVSAHFVLDHANAGLSPVKGTDWISLSLANDWVLEKYAPLPASWSTFAAMLEYPALYLPLSPSKVPEVVDASGFVLGAPSGVLRVTWSLGPQEYTGYSGMVLVKGPIGVPFK